MALPLALKHGDAEYIIALAKRGPAVIAQADQPLRDGGGDVDGWHPPAMMNRPQAVESVELFLKTRLVLGVGCGVLC